jgi:hypothetical protein
MKLATTLFLIITLVNSSFAKVDPYYKEVLQRGFTLAPGDSVIFPDGTGCKIEDFNNQICGEKWFEQTYCVAEGENVWDSDICCEGLSPQKESITDGQSTCEQEEGAWFTSRSIMYFFIGVLIPLGLFVFLASKAKKGLPKK